MPHSQPEGGVSAQLKLKGGGVKVRTIGEQVGAPASKLRGNAPCVTGALMKGPPGTRHGFKLDVVDHAPGGGRFFPSAAMATGNDDDSEGVRRQ